MMLHAARITNVEGENVIIRQLFRPEATTISFGRSMNVDEQAPEEGEDETIAFREAMSVEWRIIR